MILRYLFNKQYLAFFWMQPNWRLVANLYFLSPMHHIKQPIWRKFAQPGNTVQEEKYLIVKVLQGCILKLLLHSVNSVFILYRASKMQSAILLSFVASFSLLPCGLQSTHPSMPRYISPYVVYNVYDIHAYTVLLLHYFYRNCIKQCNAVSVCAFDKVFFVFDKVFCAFYKVFWAFDMKKLGFVLLQCSHCLNDP